MTGVLTFLVPSFDIPTISIDVYEDNQGSTVCSRKILLSSSNSKRIDVRDHFFCPGYYSSQRGYLDKSCFSDRGETCNADIVIKGQTSDHREACEVHRDYNPAVRIDRSTTIRRFFLFVC